MSIKPKKADPAISSDEFVKKLGARIKYLREQKGFTNYEKFAYKHDISRAQFGRYEKGQNLNFTTLVRIVKAFDMTLQEFFKEGFE